MVNNGFGSNSKVFLFNCTELALKGFVFLIGNTCPEVLVKLSACSCGVLFIVDSLEFPVKGVREVFILEACCFPGIEVVRAAFACIYVILFGKEGV